MKVPSGEIARAECGYYVKLYEVYKASIDHRYHKLLIIGEIIILPDKNFITKFSYLKIPQLPL